METNWLTEILANVGTLFTHSINLITENPMLSLFFGMGATASGVKLFTYTKKRVGG